MKYREQNLRYLLYYEEGVLLHPLTLTVLFQKMAMQTSWYVGLANKIFV